MTGGHSGRADDLQAVLEPLSQAFRFAVDTLDNVTATKTDPWGCDEEPTTPPPTTTSERPSESTNGPNNVPENVTGNPTGGTSHSETTLPPPSLVEAKDAAFRDHGGISGKKAWVNRVPLHQEIANQIYAKLNASGNQDASFQVLVYLPLDEGLKDKHCLPKQSANSIAGFNEKGVNYFIRTHATSEDVRVNNLWTQVKGLGSVIVDAVLGFPAVTISYSASDAKDLCASAKSEVDKAVKRDAFDVTKGGFSSAAVVRCGYEFVWYQLGYRYFTAGRAAGRSYTLSSMNNDDKKYDRKCGQIFLFP